MMKSGASPDKFGVLYCMYVTCRIQWFYMQISSRGYHSLVPGLISIFLETVWVPLINVKKQCLTVNNSVLTDTHTHMHSCTHAHTHTHLRMHTCTHTHTLTHAHTQTHTHTHTHACTHIHSEADKVKYHDFFISPLL